MVLYLENISNINRDYTEIETKKIYAKGIFDGDKSNILS